MNNIFNFRRFGLLLRKTIYEKGLVLGGTLLLTSVIILFLYTVSTTARTSSFAHNIGFVAGILSSTAFVSLLLSNFSRKSAAVSFLTLPCSNFEKWLMIVALTFLIYLPLFLFIFKVIDTFYLDYYREIAVNKFHLTSKQLEEDLPYLTYNFDKQDNSLSFTTFLACFTGFSGFTTLGSLYFNQKSYVKSALVFLGLFLVLSFLADTLFSLIIGEKVTTAGVFNFVKALVSTNEKKTFSINATESIKNLVQYFMMIFVPVILWLISLVRFSDKEI